MLAGSAFVEAIFTAIAAAFAAANGGGGLNGAFGGATLPPVKLAAIATAPAAEPLPAASTELRAAARFSSVGCSTHCTAAVAAIRSGGDSFSPTACCMHKQPHHTPSRGGSAWAMKSMP